MQGRGYARVLESLSGSGGFCTELFKTHGGSQQFAYCFEGVSTVLDFRAEGEPWDLGFRA